MQTKLTMQKTILVTGSTDSIGLETARMLVELGHNVILHGRNPVKIEDVAGTFPALKFSAVHLCRTNLPVLPVSISTTIPARLPRPIPML